MRSGSRVAAGDRRCTGALGKSRVQRRGAVLHTVRGRRDNGGVRDRRDRTKRLGRLEVRLRHATRYVHTGRSHVVAIAHLECTVLGVVGCIVCTAEAVVDVLAVRGCVLSGGVADLDTESVPTHEAARG